MKFLKCQKCKAIVGVISECNCADCGFQCCGEQLKELVANSVDAAKEKHVPVVKVDGDCVNVSVGSVDHPMLEEHYIEWIALETKQGNQRKVLRPGDKPQATFKICSDDEIVSVYAYCNLHGLWQTK